MEMGEISLVSMVGGALANLEVPELLIVGAPGGAKMVFRP
jgi:hypothetical protein